MIKNKQQTIRQYSNSLNISLQQALVDLKNAGFFCTASDEISEKMQIALQECHCRRASQREARISTLAEIKSKTLQKATAEANELKLKLEAEEQAKAEELKRVKQEILERTKAEELKKLRENELKLKLEAEEQAKAEELKKVRQEILEQAKAENLKKLRENELKRQLEAEKQAKAEESKRLKEIEELKKYALIRKTEIQKKTKADLIKIAKILDLCFGLIPKAIAERIRADCLEQVFPYKNETLTNQHVSNIYLAAASKDSYNLNDVKSMKCLLDILKDNNTLCKDILILKSSPNVCIPNWANKDYDTLLSGRTYRNDIDKLEKKINIQRKQKRYTDALINIFYVLFNFDWESLLNSNIIAYYQDIDFKIFSFIGELLIDIGAIESALSLYSIDERVFSNSNMLSLLVSGAIKIGNIEQSNDLLAILIEREPYNPSILSLQAEIKRIEQRHLLKSAFSIDFAKIDELSGIEFENLLMDKFIALGLKVESTPITSDFGADLIVENSEGTRIIVQCKRFKSKVNLKSVQEVVGAMGHYAGDIGIVITNNSFLNSAIKLAESHDIELWDGDKLVSFLAGDFSFSKIMNSI